MTNSRTPVSFIATDQPEKARDFYADVLGLRLIEASPFALVFGDSAHVLRVQIVTELSVAAHTVHGWQTKNIQKEIAELTAKGVRFEVFDQLPQDKNGVWTTPEGHRVAWFKDPSGNVLSLTEYTDA